MDIGEVLYILMSCTSLRKISCTLGNEDEKHGLAIIPWLFKSLCVRQRCAGVTCDTQIHKSLTSRHHKKEEKEEQNNGVLDKGALIE